MSADKDTTFPDRLLKKLPDGFTDTSNSMKDDELKSVIFQCEANCYTIDKEKEADVKLNAAKDLAKDMAIPYREAKTCQMAKIKYALWLLDGRGVSLDTQDAKDD